MAEETLEGIIERHFAGDKIFLKDIFALVLRSRNPEQQLVALSKGPTY